MKITEILDSYSLSADEKERYKKQMILKEIGLEGQLKLKNSSVLCVGAGGLGSPVLLYLAAAGIGTIGIVDNDHVEKSNLQRQIIHETNTIDNLKINSAKERITSFNPNTKIKTYSHRLNSKNILEIVSNFDIVCDCSDNFGTRYLVNDACLILKKPLVFGSVQGFEGQVTVFNLDEEGPNLRDLLPESPSKNSIPSCSEYGVIGVSTGLIGVLQANEIIKIILKKGEILNGLILIINLLTMSIKKFNLKGEQLTKNITDLNQFHDFYKDDECMNKNIKIQTINASNFNNIYKTRLNKILLIDVREDEEYQKSSIKGSISIPINKLEEEYFLEFIKKQSLEKEIFTICQIGKRSEIATKILMKFKIKSKSIEGGITKINQLKN